MTIPMAVLIVLACITLGIAIVAWMDSQEHESASAAIAIWGLAWLMIFALFWAGSYHATHGGWIPPGCRAEPLPPAPAESQPASKEGGR